MPSPMPLSPSEQLIEKARIALDLGRPKEAMPLLLQALGQTGSGSERAVVMERLAFAFQKMGDNDAALLWAERAVAASPDWCWAHIRRANALENLGRIDEAIGDAQTALRLSPELPWIFRTLARLYVAKKDYVQVEANAKRFQELAPGDADAYYYLADAALNKAQSERDKARRKILLDQVEADLQTGLGIDPESPYLLRLMGCLRQKQDRHDEALPYHFEAVRQMPTSEYEQWQARSGVNRYLTDPLFLLALAGWPVQGTGIFLGWGAWVSYGLALLAALVLEAPVGFFPRYILQANKAFHKQPAQTQAALLQLTAQKKEIWHLKNGITGFGIVITLLLNLPPLLLRGLWNVGVWAFHFCKHG